jgi:quercetin dioxygenase-like cupin family protein
MKIFRGAGVPFRPADASSFVGAAETRLLGFADEGVRVHVYHVRFEPGARTNWHRHSGPQWLLVTEGRVRVQQWGQPAQDVDAGDAVVVAPDEKHWHGAAPGARGAHLAVNVAATTEWLEAVSEEDYGAEKTADRPW